MQILFRGSKRKINSMTKETTKEMELRYEIRELKERNYATFPFFKET